MAKIRKIKIPINKLMVGLMVDLEMSWTQHPFLFSKFKIKSTSDIKIIHQLGIKKITVFPDQSDIQATKESAQTSNDETEAEDEPAEEEWQRKNEKLAQAETYRKKRREIAKKYKEQATMVRKLTKELKTAPANAIHNAEELVNTLAKEFLEQDELMTNLVNLGAGEHTMYNHCINVTILSMSLASVKGVDDEQLKLLARGALLHDVGKIDIPGPILNKKTKLTKAEQGVLQRHSQVGRRLCQMVEGTPAAVLQIIEGHHEYLDGTGYPNQHKDKQIDLLTRIVAVANVYDNLCNPPNPKLALTPKVALATMYSKYKKKLDHSLVQTFISTLGIYPPGSVVRLNDNSIGLVISVDPDNMMNPEVLLYNPDIPPLQALIINLAEYEDLKIENVLKPHEYPKRVYDYLGIKERVGYMTSTKS